MLDAAGMDRPTWKQVLELLPGRLPHRHITRASSQWPSSQDGAPGSVHSAPAAASASAPESPLSEIDIIGLRAVLDKESSLLRRVTWSVILAVCLSLMIIQTWKRIDLFLSDKVVTNIQHIVNDSLVFPALTLCPYRNHLVEDTLHLNESEVRRLYNQHFASASFSGTADAMYRLADVYDVRTLWTLAARDLNQEIAYGQLDCHQVMRVSQVFTILGVCLYFEAPDVRFGGSYHGFELRLRNEEESKVKYYLMISDDSNTVDIRSLTHGVFVENGWNKDIAISLKVFQKKSTGSSPCTQNTNQTTSLCHSRCFHQALTDQLGCRMPYMTLGNVDQVAYCNSSQQLRAAEELEYWMLSRGVGWEASSCSCNMTACSHFLFEWFLDTHPSCNNCASYKVFYDAMDYEETVEEFAFDLTSILCDIGGLFGLFLGLSVLQMIRVADALWRYLMLSLCKHNGGKQADRNQGSKSIHVIHVIPADATGAVQR